MKKKPMIAITPYFNIERDEPYMRPGYIKAIRGSGAIPVILPLDQDEDELIQIADTFDGFLFSGGPDIHSFFFGEETHPHCGNVNLRRDRMEMSLLKLVMERKKPILGICRGIQLLNVTLGGSIYQDIPSQFESEFPVAHTQPFAYETVSHTVNVKPDTLLARISDHDVLFVNSMHHQAVRDVAPGLVASGYASDGLVEAVEKPDYPNFFLGVQWHPEYLWENDPRANALFTEFVKSC